MLDVDYSSRDWMSGISVDCVIFGFHENQLKVLTLRFSNTEVWSLPGGYVGVKEDLDAAAQRVLLERTGLSDIYLAQFHTFGSVKRNLRSKEEHTKIQRAMGRTDVDMEWISSRFITAAYFALVDFEKVNVNVGDVSDAFEWRDISDKSPLFLDHSDILEYALRQLGANLDVKLIAFNLLADTFTMSELQAIYETILGKKLVRTNFQRKILSLNIVDRIDKKFSGGAHKAPYLYRLNTERATLFLKDGVV